MQPQRQARAGCARRSWIGLASGVLDNVSGSRTSRMTVNPFRPADEGSYGVVVSNICGSTESAPIAVTLVDGMMQLAPSLPRDLDGAAMAFDTQQRLRGR